MSAADLNIEEKRVIIESIILPLRGYQLLGIVEARDWIELLFPEFKEVRDREADEMFKQIASSRNERSDPGQR